MVARRTSMSGPGWMVGLEASGVLCRLLARLDMGGLEGLDVPALARRVAQAMHLVYGARSTGSSAARRSAAAIDAGRLIGDCLQQLQAQPAPTRSVQVVLALTTRAASAVHAIRQQAEAELHGSIGAAGGAGTPTPWETAWTRTNLRWSLGVAVVHDTAHPPLAPPLLVSAEREEADEPVEDSDDEEEEVDEAPVMELGTLKALADTLAAEDDDAASPDENGGQFLPPLAPAAFPPRQPPEQTGRELLATHLKALEADFDARQAGMAEDAGWTQLERLERSLLARADAVAWMGASVVELLAHAVVSAEASGSAFAAALPLLCMEGVDTADVVLRAAELGRAETVDGLVEAFRLAQHPEAAMRLPALLDTSATPVTQRIALRVVAERGGVDDLQLERLLTEHDATLVGTAVAHILRAGKGYALARLEYMADRTADEPAATEIVVAAAVLGSLRARERLRALVYAGKVNDRLIHALAAVGDEGDVDALAELALAGGPPSTPAMVALGWLGSARAIPTLRELALDDGFTEEATAALAQIMGPAGAADERATLGPGRWAAGAPWTVRFPAAILAGASTGALWRELAFLDLCARTGHHIPFDPTWPVAQQRAAAGSWSAIAERLVSKLPTHTWLYRGQPATTPRSP